MLEGTVDAASHPILPLQDLINLHLLYCLHIVLENVLVVVCLRTDTKKIPANTHVKHHPHQAKKHNRYTFIEEFCGFPSPDNITIQCYRLVMAAQGCTVLEMRQKTKWGGGYSLLFLSWWGLFIKSLLIYSRECEENQGHDKNILACVQP